MNSSEKNFIYHPVYQAVFLLLLFTAAYWVPLSSLYNTWMTNDDYSYGILIPFISIYFFWERIAFFKTLSIRSNWIVLPLLILFVAVSIYGILGSSGHISRPVIPILIILFVIFCFGWDFFKKFSLPLCFLIFMIPLPTVLDRTIGVFLKSVSSELGGAFLRLFGYSVYVSGNVIDLGVTKLQVVDACSGLRFLFPLMALGIVYSYFFESVRWKQVLCFLATIPIAVLTNVLRIGITGLLTYSFGSKMAEGFFHDFQGFAIFMVAFVFLFALGRLLRLFPPKNKEVELNGLKNSTAEDKSAHNLSAVIISAILMMVVGGLTLNTHALPPIKVKDGIESFPLKFSGWSGKRQFIEAEIIDASGAEEAFSAVYKRGDKEEVSLYIGYRSTAFLENVNFFHSPTVCLPSTGWKTISQSKRIIQNIPYFGELPVVEMNMEAMGKKQLVHFWFQTKDKVTHDKNINRFHLAVHAIKKDNTHDLFIRPITPVMKEEDLEEARKRIDDFTRDMMTILIPYLEKNQYEGI